MLRLFFSGIGGSGMSAIASFMADKGNTIIGSDRAFDRAPEHPVCRLLKSKGITIVKQDGEGIDKTLNCIIFSTAVEDTNPEYLKAKSLNIPIKTRPEYLIDIASSFKTIAIAGTSGKSTASGMLAFLMHRLGLSPNFIGGGRVKQFKAENNPGNSIIGDSDVLIIEACESDGTIINYTPEHSVILNIDLDHHAIGKTIELFKLFIKNTSGMRIINADDDNLKKIDIRDAIAFSVDKPSDYMARDVIYMPFRTDFSINGVRFRLSIPGKHNLYNALSCIAILSERGVPLKEIASILHQFDGIERRFDVYLNDEKHLVIDDYAHNPHKISSLMQTVRNIRENICYIFQPHGFAPTRMMKDEYIETFAKNLHTTDHLILLPIFYTGGTVQRDISSHDLANGIKMEGGSVEVIDDRGAILRRLDEWDNYVIFGARDESLAEFAKTIAISLKNNY